MREITRSVKVDLKCLIALVLLDVDLSYWTSKVQHIVASPATVSNICTANAQKRLFMNPRCKFRHRRSIRLPRFPVREQNVGDLATFSVDFFYFICRMSAIFLLQVCLTYWPRKYTTRVDPHVDNFHQVTWWPWPSTFWYWAVVRHGGSRGQTCHQVWRPYDYSFMSYEL